MVPEVGLVYNSQGGNTLTLYYGPDNQRWQTTLMSDDGRRAHRWCFSAIPCLYYSEMCNFAGIILNYTKKPHCNQSRSSS